MGELLTEPLNMNEGVQQVVLLNISRSEYLLHVSFVLK